jgi:hypothetical protein
MSLNNTEIPGGSGLSLRERLQKAFGTPLGMAGVMISTVFFVLSVSGLIGQASGLIDNPYFIIVTGIVFPLCMMVGLFLLPAAVYLGWRKRKRNGLEIGKIDLSDVRQQKIVILVLVLSVINAVFFILVIQKGYRFMGSPSFCGLACHRVMGPEYATHGRSSHAKVGCLQCHAAPGVKGFLQVKLSGLHRLEGMITGKYNRPLSAPVKDLPSVADTCGKCHQSDRYSGSKIKTFVHYSNGDQENPERQEIILNVGGRSPLTGQPEGIHWHAGTGIKIEYQPLDAKRTRIGAVRVSRSEGVIKEYRIPGDGGENIPGGNWRTMDCTDCHNRLAHIFDGPLDIIDLGLNIKKINPGLAGIREDSLTVLKKEYATRVEAEERIGPDLLKLQEQRNGPAFVKTHRGDIVEAGVFLAKASPDNVWPEMKITWGTFKSHIGHRYSKEGYGCFRCHDEKHTADAGETISQDCNLCHAEPE